MAKWKHTSDPGQLAQNVYAYETTLTWAHDDHTAKITPPFDWAVNDNFSIAITSVDSDWTDTETFNIDAKLDITSVNNAVTASANTVIIKANEATLDTGITYTGVYELALKGIAPFMAISVDPSAVPAIGSGTATLRIYITPHSV